MKKFIPILVFLFSITTNVFAQQKSILKIRLSDSSPISVAIDRRFYNEENSVITVRNFPSGRHYLRVYRWSYNFNRNNLVYEGEINLMPNTLSVVVVDRRSGFARISNRRLYENYNNGDAYDWNRNEHFRDHDNWDDDGVYNSQGNGNNNYSNNNNNQGNYSNNNNGNNQYNGQQGMYNGYSNQNSLISQQDISDLQSRVADRITDTDKLKLLQTALKNRMMNTEQARQILSWLSFENTKLEFAKWAYPNIADKNNYWKIENEFTFENTKSEFNDFLNNRR